MQSQTETIPFEHAKEWGHLSETINAFFNSNALFSACELGLFEFLNTHPKSSLDEVAEGLGLSTYAARVLLLSIANTGLVEKSGEAYSNSLAAQSFLVPENSNCLVPWVRYMQLISRESIGHYTQSLRESKNCGDGFLRTEQDGSIYEKFDQKTEFSVMFNEAMKSLSRNLVNPLKKVKEFENVSHLIDVGGGGGEVARTLCQAFPNLSVTVLDKQKTCEQALENAKAHQLSDRINARAVDVLSNQPWVPGGQASVLMSHFISFFNPDEIRTLYRKAKDYLGEGDRLFIWDTMSNDTETGNTTASRLSIYFLNTATGKGMAYPAKSHIKLLEEEGYVVEKVYDVDAIEHKLIMAKPA